MLRERSARKAKEKAVEHLHEITTNYYKASNNNENNTTPKRQSKANKTTKSETLLSE